MPNTTKAHREAMTVRAWKDDDRPTWIVQVGDSMYEMDSKAHRPDGVCIYQGTAVDLAWTVRDRPVRQLPLGIVQQIARLARREADTPR